MRKKVGLHFIFGISKVLYQMKWHWRKIIPNAAFPWLTLYLYFLSSPPLFPFSTGFEAISANVFCLTTFLHTYHPVTEMEITIWAHDGRLALMITLSLLSSYWLSSLLSFPSYYDYHHECSGKGYSIAPSFELPLKICPN